MLIFNLWIDAADVFLLGPVVLLYESAPVVFAGRPPALPSKTFHLTLINSVFVPGAHPPDLSLRLQSRKAACCQEVWLASLFLGVGASWGVILISFVCGTGVQQKSREIHCFCVIERRSVHKSEHVAQFCTHSPEWWCSNELGHWLGKSFEARTSPSQNLKPTFWKCPTFNHRFQASISTVTNSLNNVWDLLRRCDGPTAGWATRAESATTVVLRLFSKNNTPSLQPEPTRAYRNVSSVRWQPCSSRLCAGDCTCRPIMGGLIMNYCSEGG